MKELSTFIRTRHAQRRNRRTRVHPNRAGGLSYSRSLHEQVVQVLSTGTLGDTYYVSGQQLGQEAVQVLLRAREVSPEFLARALVWAREEGYMKTLPLLGLTVLSGGRGKTASLFRSVFDRVVLTPDDLRTFVALCRGGRIPGRNGLGGVALAATRDWLGKVSEYHAVKYGSAASRVVTLRDILRMSHPKAATPAHAERFAWLVRGKAGLGNELDLNPQIRSLEALKSAATEDAQLALIREGRLPYEVVVPSLKGTTTGIWSELLHQAPYLNLLWSLQTFARHGVFRNEDNVRYAVERLTNPRAVQRSKVLPFRFFSAWKAYAEGGDHRIADALRAAMELAFVNMPDLGSRVAIGTDTSGSMGRPISDKGTIRYIDIAGIFTGALLRQAVDRVIPIPFDTQVHLHHNLSPRDDVLITTSKIARYGGGGTAVGAPVQYLLDGNIQIDTFIGITDQESWAEGRGYWCREDFLTLWRRYRSEINPQAKAYLITIAPYRDAVVPAGEPNVRFIYGWSDKVLRYIALDVASGVSQVQAISAMPLTGLGSANGDSVDDAEDAQTTS